MDYVLQKEVKLDPQKVDSTLEVIIRDDEIVQERTYPKLYFFLYVDGYLLAKDSKSLSSKNRINNKFYSSFHSKVKIRAGLRKVKVVYKTYRNNKFQDLTFEKKINFATGEKVIISFNKKFSLN